MKKKPYYLIDDPNEQLHFEFDPTFLGFPPGTKVRIKGPSRFENGFNLGTVGTVLYNKCCGTGVFDPNSAGPTVCVGVKPYRQEWFGYNPENLEIIK